MILDKLRKYDSDKLKGLSLVIAAVFALSIANIPYIKDFYHYAINFHLGLVFGNYSINHDVKHWINDGLMSLFFLWISLEIKEELLHGHLSSFSKAIFPVIAAMGGVVIPALLFYFIAKDNADIIQAWAIPIATDIAFVIAILSFFGRRVSKSLKVFLITLAVADDFFAIAIIAIFYTADINFTMLMYAGALVLFLIFLNLASVRHISSYLIFGGLLWLLIAESGLHPTIAGVILGFVIPYRTINGINPGLRIYDDLTFTVSYMVLPLFAFANAGIYLFDLNPENININLVLGILVGLVFGKPIGITTFSLISHYLGIAKKSSEFTWSQLFAVSAMAGIGFTISIFIANLTFGESGLNSLARLVIIVSSILAGIIGTTILILCTSKKRLVKVKVED